MMMLQFRRVLSGSSSDTRPLNPVCTSVLSSSEWNIVSEAGHLLHHGSHFNQIISICLKSVCLKEHGITTQSPASAVIVASLRETQKFPLQNSFNAPANENGEG